MKNSAATRSSTAGQVVRFLIVGGTNTILTYAIFVGLGLVIPAWVAYSIAFALGLAWTTFGSSRLVFRSQFSMRRVTIFLACYLLVYGVGRLVILLVEPRGLIELAATSLIVLVTTTPLTFFIGRYVFVGSRATPPVKEDPMP